MFRRKNIDKDAVIAETSNQAIDYIIAGVKYFLIKYPLYTIIALLILFGSTLYATMDYYQKYQYHKQHVEQIKGK